MRFEYYIHQPLTARKSSNHSTVLGGSRSRVHTTCCNGYLIFIANKSNPSFLLYCWLHSLLLKEIYLYVVSWPTLLNGFYWGHFQKEVLILSSSVSCSSLKYFYRKKFSQFLSTLQVFNQRILTLMKLITYSVVWII